MGPSAGGWAGNNPLVVLVCWIATQAELLQNQATSSRGQAGQPASVPGTPRAALTSAAVDKLLTLELEVVQLQQSLQIAQLDYETHTVQLQSLAQRVQEAECRAQVGAVQSGGRLRFLPLIHSLIHSVPAFRGPQAAQERASSMAQQIQEAEVQCSSLQQENAALRAQLEASGGQRKQQQQTDVQEQLAGIRAGLEAAQAECGRLRKQTAKVRPLEAECAQLQRAVSVHSAHASEARERLSRVRQENRQLRAQIGDACGALKALGIPVHQVFSRTALANANTAAAAPSHLVSPAKPGTTSGTHAEAAPGPEGSQAQRVPRLQLSAISLEQLQQRASLQQQPADIHGVQRDECAAPCGEQSAEHAHPLTAVPAADQTQQVAGPGGAAAATKSQGRGPPGKPQALAAGPWPTAPPPVLIPASPAFQSLTSEQWQTAKAHMSLESPTWQSVNSGLSGGAKWQTTMSEAATALSPGINGAIPAHRPLPPDPAHIQQAGMLQQLVRQPAKGVHPAEVVAAQPDTARSHGGAAHARMQQQQQQLFVAAPPAARGARPASAAGGTPILRYGQLPAFHEVRQAYQAVMAAGATGDRTAKFVNSLLSSSSAVETNPRKVEPVIEVGSVWAPSALVGWMLAEC